MKHDLIDHPANLSNVLNMLSANNTETIRNAEKLLKPALKQPAFLLSLLTQMRESPVPEIRQHAALLMKKKLPALFKKLNLTHQQQLKSQILNVMKSENVKSVSVSVAGCVAMTAKSAFSVGSDWPELFQTVMALSQSPLEAQRCLNYSLLEQVKHIVNIIFNLFILIISSSLSFSYYVVI